MGQLVSSLYISLDGYAGDTDDSMSWVTDIFGKEQVAYGVDHIRRLEMLVLGRVTYQIMAAYWPSAPSDDPFAELMNQIPKIVFSNTLAADDISWSNTQLVRGDAIGEARRLKEGSDGRIGIGGSISLLQSLMRADLVDRLHLQVQPVVLGARGKKAVFEGLEQTDLKLIETSVLDAQVVAVEYGRA
jgi:dihydrofolate reductase